MKFGVVVFPGSNCDHDMFYNLKTNLNQKVEFLWHKETSLKKCDFILHVLICKIHLHVLSC